MIDAAGKHVYPGLIAGQQLARPDRDRPGPFDARLQRSRGTESQRRSIIAYNTDSKIIPTVRSNGVLLAEVVPQGSF